MLNSTKVTLILHLYLYGIWFCYEFLNAHQPPLIYKWKCYTFLYQTVQKTRRYNNFIYIESISRDRENKEARLTVIVGEIFNTIGRLLEDLEDRNYR